jgi:hypothetical protein
MALGQGVQRLEVESDVVIVMEVPQTGLAEKARELVAAALGNLNAETPAVIGFE